MDTLCITDGTWESDFVDMTYKMLPELRTSQRGHLNNPDFPHMRNVIYVGQKSTAECITLPSWCCWAKTWTTRYWRRPRNRSTSHDVVNMQYTPALPDFLKAWCSRTTTLPMMASSRVRTWNSRRMTNCASAFLYTTARRGAGYHELPDPRLHPVMVEKFDPLVVLASIHKERCTALYGVPPCFCGTESPHVQYVRHEFVTYRHHGGALCPVELIKEVEKMYLKVTSVYGLTETAPGMTQSNINDPFEKRCTTVGRDFPHVDVKVINPETGEFCKTGEQGEMCCKVSTWWRDITTILPLLPKSLTRQGYLHSGDLGVQDEEGYYKITGRIKDMIIRGGENIYPREIEEFLYKMPEIKDVQVAGVPSEKYGEP